jgi:multidrug resistance efflux pump
MTRIAHARGLIRPLIVVAVGAALISAAVLFRRTAASPTAPPPSAATSAGEAHDGVVCFGTVDLESGVASLYPLQPGRVADVLATENQKVTEGAELLRLEDGIARSRLAEADAGVMLAQVQLDWAREQPAQHRARIAQQRAMRDAMTSRAAAARGVLDREEKLANSSIVTDSDHSIRAEKIREMEALEQVEAHRLEELEAQDVAVEIRRAEYELKAAEARRKQALLTLEDYRMRAPRPGTVLRILVGPGDVIGAQTGQPVLLFAADGPQVIRATVEQEFASHVEEGEPALVQDEADPNATWRGRVGHVAGWYNQRRAVLHDPSQMSDVRTVECMIILEPGQPHLRLGQSVRVFIGRVRP